MKKLVLVGLQILLLTPVLAVAQSPFDGTWKTDLSKAQLSKKPLVYLLQDGIYQCKTCPVPFSIKANGEDQKITGYPYFDSLSVRVVDDRTLAMTSKKDGKIVGTQKRVVSSDGNTLSLEFSDSSATNADPVTGKGEWTRITKGPAGSHAISGSWRVSMENLSNNGLTLTFKVEGDSLSMSNPTGQSYSAKLDGTEAPYKGDPGVNRVSVKGLGENTIEETDKLDRKIISVSRMTVSADGKTMTTVFENKLTGATSTFVAEKQ